MTSALTPSDVSVGVEPASWLTDALAIVAVDIPVAAFLRTNTPVLGSTPVTVQVGVEASASFTTKTGTIYVIYIKHAAFFNGYTHRFITAKEFHPTKNCSKHDDITRWSFNWRTLVDTCRHCSSGCHFRSARYHSLSRCTGCCRYSCRYPCSRCTYRVHNNRAQVRIDWLSIVNISFDIRVIRYSYSMAQFMS